MRPPTRDLGAVLLALSACGRFGFGDRAEVDSLPVDPYTAVVLADQPLAYWRLGDTSALAMTDLSGHGHTGTATTGVTLGSSSLLASSVDSAASFDGTTGYVLVPDHVELRLQSAITMEAWIRATSFDHAAGAPYPRILHKGSIGNTGYALLAHQIGTTNAANLRVEIEGIGTLGISGTTVLQPGVTYHVAATWDGATLAVYVDGVLDASLAASGAIPTTADPIQLGRRPDNTRYWAGVLDEVAIYGRALAASQIAMHAAVGR